MLFILVLIAVVAAVVEGNQTRGDGLLEGVWRSAQILLRVRIQHYLRDRDAESAY